LNFFQNFLLIYQQTARLRYFSLRKNFSAICKNSALRYSNANNIVIYKGKNHDFCYCHIRTARQLPR
jgi:hypothetical protein